MAPRMATSELSKAVFLSLGFAACAHGGTGEGVSHRGLIGTWQLVGVVAVRPNGETILTKWGNSPSGSITYTQDGHMAVQIMADSRPKDPTPEELLEGYLAYGGTYTYDTELGTVTHHLQYSIYPSAIGESAIRKVEHDGDQMTLTPVETYNRGGEEVLVKLTWRRLR